MTTQAQENRGLLELMPRDGSGSGSGPKTGK
jgi:hypothetical protein